MISRAASLTTLAVISACLGAAPPAQATLITVNSGSFAGMGNLGGPGTGRAQGFQALDNFSITSVGIEANLTSESYDVVIHASADGSNPGAVLATTSGVVGGSGFGFYDLGINFSFGLGSFYIVNWRPTDGSFNVVNNDIAYYRDSALPTNVFPFRLVDGVEGFNAQNDGNSLHPNMRYDVGSAVPEPATLLLLGSGIVGLAARRRRAS